jgi:hypothetical protein
LAVLLEEDDVLDDELDELEESEPEELDDFEEDESPDEPFLPPSADLAPARLSVR